MSIGSCHGRPAKDPGACNNAECHRGPGDGSAGGLSNQSWTAERRLASGAVDAICDTSQATAPPRGYPAKGEASIELLSTNLAAIREKLSELETLLATVGRATLTSATTALDHVQYPAIVIDRSGLVLDVNEHAQRLFDANFYMRNRRLLTNDRQAMASLQAALNSLPDTSDDKPLTVQPIIVRRKNKSAIVIRMLPVHPAARSPFVGARALLTMSVIEARPLLDQRLLMRVFSLTPAEARLAALMVEGKSPEAAAAKLGVKRETARNQLKAIFAKTETNRQGQLVALLSSLCPLV
jgi:DNA-binding CsgD family transcriptional regulator